MKTLAFENRATKYTILLGEWKDPLYLSDKVCFVWLSAGVGGVAFTWTKGDNLYAGYVQQKVDINLTDLTSILSGIKHHEPELIGDLNFFDPDAMYIPPAVKEVQ